jgi:hypothetical protein
MNNEPACWDFIPQEVRDAVRTNDDPIDVDCYGPLAQAIRDEAVETGKSDFEVVYHYLFKFLDTDKLPKVPPVNCLPVRVRVIGDLAALLGANAAARGISPQDSAIEILSEIFDVPHPQAKKRGKGKSVPKGLAFTVQVPGIVCQVIRRNIWPTSISSEYILGVLRGYFPDPNDHPRIPGL